MKEKMYMYLVIGILSYCLGFVLLFLYDKKLSLIISFMLLGYVAMLSYDLRKVKDW